MVNPFIACFGVRIAGRTVIRALAPLAITLAAGCATSPTTLTVSGSGVRHEPSRYSLESTELGASRSTNADEAIRRARPEWLRANPTLRHGEQAERAVVYIGDAFLGDLDVLRMVQTAEISSIRFLTPMEARGRFGPSCGCGAGAIVMARSQRPQP